LAEQRLRQTVESGLSGFTPLAMLWQPETKSQEKHAFGPEWQAFQGRWARPALVYSTDRDELPRCACR